MSRRARRLSLLQALWLGPFRHLRGERSLSCIGCLQGVGIQFLCSSVDSTVSRDGRRLLPAYPQRREGKSFGRNDYHQCDVPLTLSWLSMGTTAELRRKVMTHLIAQLGLQRYKADVKEPCPWATQASSSHGTAGTTHGGSRFSRYFAISTQSSPFSALAVLWWLPASGPARHVRSATVSHSSPFSSLSPEREVVAEVSGATTCRPGYRRHL